MRTEYLKDLVSTMRQSTQTGIDSEGKTTTPGCGLLIHQCTSPSNLIRGLLSPLGTDWTTLVPALGVVVTYRVAICTLEWPKLIETP